MTTKTKKRTKTRVQDLEQIIKIQEKIIKANKTETMNQTFNICERWLSLIDQDSFKDVPKSMKEEIKRERELTALRGWLNGLKDVKKVNGIA